MGVLVLSFLSGCGFTYHFKNGSTLPGEHHDEWASYFFFGIVGDHEIDVREFCGANDIHEIATGNNFLTWFVGFLTIGIYTPRKVNITCSGGARSTSFEIDFGRQGEPARVTKHVGALEYSGDVKALGEGRYGVALHEGSAP